MVSERLGSTSIRLTGRSSMAFHPIPLSSTLKPQNGPWWTMPKEHHGAVAANLLTARSSGNTGPSAFHTGPSHGHSTEPEGSQPQAAASPTQDEPARAGPS